MLIGQGSEPPIINAIGHDRWVIHVHGVIVLVSAVV